MDIGLVNVVANGPSAKHLDLRSLTGLTVGMNAAYRFWEKIGWQPDFYACLDSQAVQNHVDWISKSISEEKIKGFFLHPRAKDVFPNLSHPQKVLYLSDVRKVRINLPADANVFKSPWASFVTTGSWAIRYAAYLGAKHIRLYGFDLSYKKTNSKKQGLLKRQATPDTSNENYFFDEYQVPGDKFNVPNPWFIPFDLHKFAVLEAIKEVSNAYPHVKFESFGGHPQIAKLLDSNRFGNGGLVG